MSKVTTGNIFIQKFVFFFLGIKLKDQINWDFFCHGIGITGNTRRLNKTRVLTKIK